MVWNCKYWQRYCLILAFSPLRCRTNPKKIKNFRYFFDIQCCFWIFFSSFQSNFGTSNKVDSISYTLFSKSQYNTLWIFGKWIGIINDVLALTWDWSIHQNEVIFYKSIETVSSFGNLFYANCSFLPPLFMLKWLVVLSSHNFFSIYFYSQTH